MHRRRIIGIIALAFIAGCGCLAQELAEYKHETLGVGFRSAKEWNVLVKTDEPAALVIENQNRNTT